MPAPSVGPLSLSPPSQNMLVKNEEVNYAKFSTCDRFAVKICKLCLQTALACGGIRPLDPQLGISLGTSLGTFVPRSSGLWPQMKIPGDITDVHVR